MKIKNKMFLQAEIVKSAGGENDNGTFRGIVSSGKPDRTGDVVDPKGWQFASFKKNPVILWGHEHSEPPIGKGTRIYLGKNGKVMLHGEFAPTPFAQEIRSLVVNGFINAFSVGFKPLDYEERKDANGSWLGYNIKKQELLEVSFVNVPALDEALLTQAKSKGLNLPVLTKALEENNEEESEEKEVDGVDENDETDEDEIDETDETDETDGADENEENEEEASEEEDSEDDKKSLERALIDLKDEMKGVKDQLKSIASMLEKGETPDEGGEEKEKVEEEPESKESKALEAEILALRVADKAIEKLLRDKRKK